MLELLIQAFGKIVTLHHELHIATAILDFDKGNFAHHAFGHHAAGQRECFIHPGQCLDVVIRKPLVQFSSVGIGLKIVGVGNGFRFKCVQLLPPFRDQAIFIDCRITAAIV